MRSILSISFLEKEKRNIKIVLLLFWLMFLGKISSYKNSTNGLEIRPKNQPGTFHEKSSAMRFIDRYWKIVILMDVRVPTMESPTFRKHTEVIAGKASFLEANKTLIQEMRTRIPKKFKQTSEYINTLKMKKKGLVPTVSIEDQKYYNKKIEYLKLMEDGVMMDSGRSVLLLNSTLDDLCGSNIRKDRELLGNLMMLLPITEDFSEISGGEFESKFDTLMNYLIRDLKNIFKGCRLLCRT